MCYHVLVEGKWILFFQKFQVLYQNIPFFYLLIKPKPWEFLAVLFIEYFCCSVCCLLNANAERILYAFVPC